MQKAQTYFNEILPDYIPQEININWKRVAGFIWFEKLGNSAVPSPGWRFEGWHILRIIAAREAEINQIVLDGSTSSRRMFHWTTEVASHIVSHGMRWMKVKIFRIHHNIVILAVTIEAIEKQRRLIKGLWHTDAQFGDYAWTANPGDLSSKNGWKG